MPDAVTISKNFRVASPSSSTISYTVSSLSSPRARVVTVARHLVRLVVSLYALLVLLSKARTTGLFLPGASVDAYLLHPLQYGFVDSFIVQTAQSLNWWTLSVASLMAIYLCLRRDYTEETLLVLQGLGIQTSTTSPYFFMAPTTTFIPTSHIQDIVINEAFKGFGVRFYLAVIVKGASQVLVVFPHLLPRRPVLEEVWRGSRKCLYSGAG